MKKIEAIIKPFQLEAVKDALSELGLDGMTVTEVKGFRRPGYTEVCGGVEYAVDFRPKIKVEVIVEDAIADAASDAVMGAVENGENGHGKVFVSEIDEVVRIRTAETGNRAA